MATEKFPGPLCQCQEEPIGSCSWQDTNHEKGPQLCICADIGMVGRTPG